MGFQISPGVQVSEIDLTTVIPAVATTDAAFAGVFRWGPVDDVNLVDSEDTLIAKYGKPSNLNPESWFTARNYLAYGNRLHINRASHTTGNTEVQTTVMTQGSNTVTVESIGLNITAGDAVYSTNIREGTTVVSVAEVGANTDIVLTTQPIATSNAEVQYFDTAYCFNAIANTNSANLAGQIVKNDTHYTDVTFDDDVQFVAKYPGEMGNSLKVSVCTTANAFTSAVDITGTDATFTIGSNTATIVDESAGNTDIVDTIAADFSVGDVVKVGNSTIGTQYLTITNIADTYVNATSNDAVLEISFDDRYTLYADFTANTSLTRYWQYWNVVDGSPGQSNYQLYNGNTSANDELHVVVTDEDGKFTGVPGTILEVFSGLSRATDAKTDAGAVNYYKEVLNNNSKYVWYAGDISGATSNTALNLASSTADVPYAKSFIGGRDTKNETDIAIGDLALAYDKFKMAETIDISLVLTGKSKGGTHGEQLFNYLIDNIAEVRKDCVVFGSPHYADVVNNASADEEEDVVEFRNACRASSYAVLDSGYKYQYDKYNDVYRWIPLNGDTAGLCARTDYERDPWWSPAGFNRGQIKNVIKLSWNPRKAQRDMLYKNGVNPVVTFPGQGTLLYGDKTLLAKPSAFDRINVRRLFIVLEKAISTAAKYMLFEFNDEFTRDSFVALVTPYLRDVQGRRGIIDFHVVCDETNNTPEVIDRNEFVGDIYIKPAHSINFIQLNFIAVRTGVEFSEVIGNF